MKSTALKRALSVIKVMASFLGLSALLLGTAIAGSPEGGVIYSIAIDPENTETLYVGTLAGGVYKSTDGAESWNWSGYGERERQLVLAGHIVQSLAMDPMDSNTIYAGTYTDGVFKSTNGGGIWFAVSTGLPPEVLVSALAIDPMDSNTIYAGTNGGGVFRSTNGGSTWAAVNTGLTNQNVRSLAIDPLHSNTIYAGTGGGGVFRSTNRGGDWNAINTGLFNRIIRAIAISADRGEINILGRPPWIHLATSGNGTFCSMDGGETWRQ